MSTEVTAGVWAGVSTLLDSYLRISTGDRLAILYTADCREPAAWTLVAARERGLDPVALPMRPLEDAGLSTRLWEALRPALSRPGRVVILTLEKHSMSHFSMLREVQARLGVGRCDVVRIINGSAEFFSHAMNSTPEELSEYNASLYGRFRAADRITIQTPAGTSLEVEFDHECYAWTSNRGMLRKGSFLVLPAGELATYPARIKGRLVADAAFNANVYTTLDSRLSRHPVSVEIADGQAVDFSCDDPQISKFIEMCWDIPNARRVGELGFGTNAGISQLVPLNSHINERVPGVHIGFGEHNQPLRVVDYRCDIHLDLIATGGMVISGEEDVIDLSRPVRDGTPHPDGVNDEDIDGDCCALSFDQCRALGALS
ncbi:hypothetical protein AB0J28_17750 [Streptosporangium canum]|uniref:hypothetical protein n=1 Tax=Streptosporangium canum TaxID=324952 RepID=UPI003437D7E8